MKATYKSYPSNLTTEQWIFIAPYLPVAKSGGRPRSTNLQAVINAIFYVLCSGCSWRMLPGDFPAWQTVYSYFRRWKLDGTWVRIHRYLRDWVRLHLTRRTSPSVAVIDSQSVEIGVLSNNSVGYDGGKNIKGRKRHVLVDTMGLILMVVVTAANISDRAGAKTLFARLKSHKRWLKRLFLIYTDGTYRGETFVRWIYDTYDWILEAVLRVDNHKGFRVVPKRWVVERTFGWRSAFAQIVVRRLVRLPPHAWCRRLSKDYERLPQTSEAFIYLAMIRIMIRRLA